jgi:hypothetical protein
MKIMFVSMRCDSSLIFWWWDAAKASETLVCSFIFVNLVRFWINVDLFLFYVLLLFLFLFLSYYKRILCLNKHSNSNPNVTDFGPKAKPTFKMTNNLNLNDQLWVNPIIELQTKTNNLIKLNDIFILVSSCITMGFS